MLLMPMFRDEFYDSFLDKLPAPCAQSRTDVMETADAFVIKVDLPGFDKDQFDIEVGLKPRSYALSGSKTKKRKRRARSTTRERRKVEFSRSFRFGTISSSKKSAPDYEKRPCQP
ncbi:Hsp20/alpha_crystallin family protein [Hexamita inflata]|uniref:Hsp20/alpha crystallin family protein n=1 Tax=Hexamita inflata TaxID=28002 RepID=A0AA86U731_9EUKA|nr:Hsp20/alpha crystallin family protein [Hexamita inflata]